MRFETHSWALWQQVAGDPATEASTSMGWTANAVLTLVFAALSVLVAGIGAWLSNQRARAAENAAGEALQDARLARRQALELALWTNLLEAVNRFMNFDPAREPVETRLDDLRIRMMVLIDHFDAWDGFDTWLAEEHALGTAYGRQSMQLHQKGESVDAAVARNIPYSDWAAGLITNLRWIRRNGYKPKTVNYLYGEARQRRETLYRTRKWGPMPMKVPGLMALDPNMFPDEA